MPDYVLRDAEGKQLGPKGFFAQGFFSAINWEQVARLEQLWARQVALHTVGPTALKNTCAGQPQRIIWSWPPAACRKHVPRAHLDTRPALLIASFVYGAGQLIYYVQAVDMPRAPGLQASTGFVTQALTVANRTSTAGLMGVLPLFLGMRVKLTRKLLPPELVQEASGEVVGIAFHDEEGFEERSLGTTAPARPPATHPCWQRGWVMLDRLPKYVAERFDDQKEDYTGLGRPGVFFVEPHSDNWSLRCRTVGHVDRPRAPSRARRTKTADVQCRRHQIPLAPERVGTYQGQQGKIIRGPDREPLGHTIDLRKPQYMDTKIYKQHLYMILGRARSLDWCLFRNFPQNADGEPDWELFETGPPDFLVHFFAVLEERAEATVPLVEDVRRKLKIFPSWQQRPRLEPDPAQPGRFLYDSVAWDNALGRETCKRGAAAVDRVEVKRRRAVASNAAEYMQQQAQPLAVVSRQ